MTALLGYTHRELRFAFFGADDLAIEGGRRSVENKVLVVGARYAVGAFGLDTAMSAARQIRHLHFTSAAKLVCEIAKRLVSQAATDHAEFLDEEDRGERNDRAKLEKEHANLAILDVRNFELLTCSFGSVFPPRSRYSTTLKHLPDGVVHLINPPDPSAPPVDEHWMRDPRARLASLIPRLRADPRCAGYVFGEVGASVTVRGDEMDAREVSPPQR